MKYFSHFLLVWLSLVMAVSCVSRKPAEPVVVTKTKTIREVVKDTIFKVKADSSFYKAYIECIDGKPFLKPYLKQASGDFKESSSRPGKYLKAPKVELNPNGNLQVNCIAQAQKLFKSWKQTYIHEQEPLVVKVPKVVYKVKPYSWFIKIQLWVGRIILILVGAFIIYQLIKIKWKIF